MEKLEEKGFSSLTKKMKHTPGPGTGTTAKKDTKSRQVEAKWSATQKKSKSKKLHRVGGV